MKNDIPASAKSANQGDQVRSRSHQHFRQWATGDGAETLFALEKTPRDITQIQVYVAGVLMRPDDKGTTFDWSLDGAKITFTAAPANGDNILFDILT